MLRSDPLRQALAEPTPRQAGKAERERCNVVSAARGTDLHRSQCHLVLLLVSLWTAACGTSGEPETRFEVLLESADRWTETDAATVIPVEELSSVNRLRGYTVGRFADSSLSFGVEFLSSQIQFDITNRSGTPATILWDSTVYLDPDGNEHHGFSSLERSRSAIAPGSRLRVLGAPADFTAPTDNGFALRGILQPPPSVDPVRQDSRERYCNQLGKELTVRLPIRVGDELRLYSMHFEITDIFVIEFRNGASRRRERWAGCS